jgi:hypothetical protein
MIRGVVAGGVLAASVVCGGTAFAADASYPGPNPGGGGSVPGGTGGTGSTGGTGTSGGGATGATTTGFTSTTSNGGSVSSGGAGTTSSSSSLPFTGFELATALTLGVGAIGAGSVVVLASRKRRDTSAVA